MANKTFTLVPISKTVILRNIQNAGYSIRRLAKLTDYSDRSIRSYINRGEMPEKLVHQIDRIVRPKVHPIKITFTPTIYISEDILRKLAAYSIDGSTDEDPCFHDVELHGDEAEDLWFDQGSQPFDWASISIDAGEFEKYRDLIEESRKTHSS